MPPSPFIKDFEKLTSHYRERKNFKFALEDMREKTYFNHLSTWTRIKIFLSTKRKRFFYLFLIFLTFNITSNLAGFIIARLERSARKYKKKWIFNKNPLLMTYQSAVDTLYEPKAMTTVSTDRLSEAFLKYDRVLKDGMSRLLILRVMEKVITASFLMIFVKVGQGMTVDQ